MSCAHEHAEAGGHGGAGDHSGHSHEVPLGDGPQDSLYLQIDVPHVVAMNAVGGADAGQRVIKTWADREDETRYVESDTDDSLIIKIPFLASVSLRSITIKSGPFGQTPQEVHIYRDAPEMDFSDTSRPPTQKLEMVETRECAEYQLKASKFAGVSSLTLFIPGNTSDGEEETTRVSYIGLRGSHQPLPGRPGIIIYESAARPTDHKLEHVKDAAGWRPGM